MDALEYERELHECRAKLAWYLGWKEVPNDTWGHVWRLGLVFDAITGGDEESWQQLKNEAADYRRELGEGPPAREERGAPQQIEVKLAGDTKRHAEAFSEVAVALAEQRPDVRNFRRSYLRDGLLTIEEADAFLDGRVTGRSTLDQSTTVRIRFDRFAGTLARFYGWRERDAAHFVLTGREPEYRPVRVAVGFGESIRDHVPNTARVVITSDVWVDAREVERVFRTAQRQLLGGDNRKKPDKVLEAVRFVARQIREHGYPPPWRELLRTWNRTHSESPYKSHNAFVNAFKRFVHPEYNRPKWKRSDTS